MSSNPFIDDGDDEVVESVVQPVSSSGLVSVDGVADGEDYSDNWLLSGDEGDDFEFALPDIEEEQLSSGKPKRNVGMLAPQPLPDVDDVIPVGKVSDSLMFSDSVEDEVFSDAHEGDFTEDEDLFIGNKPSDSVSDSVSSDDIGEDFFKNFDMDTSDNELDDGLVSVLSSISDSFEGAKSKSADDDYWDYFENEEEEDFLSGFNLDVVISKAIDMGASDIHISSDKYVAFSVLGEIIYMQDFGVPSGNVLMRVQQNIISNVLESDFIQELELDTSYVVKEGPHKGRRLRLSIGKSFGDLFFVMRVIADVVPSPADLGIEGTLLSWVKLPNGLVMVNGPTGTGKAVEQNTLIPTELGLKKAIDVCVGDVLFDENGKKTKVTEIHKSNDVKHYEVTFDNGQKIKTAGNHLWRVESLNEWKNYGPWVRELLSKEDYEKALMVLSSRPYSDDTLIKISDLKKMFSESSAELIQRNVNNNVEQIIMSRVPLYSREYLLNCIDVKTFRNKDLLVGTIVNDNTYFEDDKISYYNLVKLIGKKKSINMIDDIPCGFVQYNIYDALESLVFDSNRRFEQIEVLSNRGHSDRPEMILSTNDMFNLGVSNGNGRTNWSVPFISSPVEFDEKDLVVHPYTLGAWLGDGFSDKGDICGVDKEVMDKCISIGEVLEREIVRENGKGQPISLWRFKNLKENLNYLGILNKIGEPSKKDIPDDYIYSSVQQRIDLISGLMDTDGTVSSYGYSEIAMTNENVVRKLHYIVSSLGWHVNEVKVKKGSYKKDGVKFDCKDVYRFSFSPREQIYNVKRKKDRTDEYLSKVLKQGIRHNRHYIKDIREIKDSPGNYICFEVDSPNHLYLCSESFIATHNSTSIASMIREIQLTRAQKVITLERPIEFIYPDDGKALITQREIGKDARSFARSLDSAMRQAPDIIVVGEVRNRIEVNELLRAAETGHLAISTMHTVSPASTINRIMGLYEGDDQRRILYSLADVARGFANQVLIKTVDGKGRIAVRETLAVNPEVSHMIQKGDVRGIQEYQLSNGQAMEQELVKVVREGKVLEKDARDQAADPALFDSLMRRVDK